MIIGHTPASEILATAINQRQHHGFLLLGFRGIGKATFARNLAVKTLTNSGPFAESVVKQQCLSGAYPNYFNICQTLSDDGKHKSDITIEQIRTLLGSLKQKAAFEGPRIILIDSIDNLNRQAANALLKMLEEPPQDTFFLLICHNIGSVLPTIRSRCLVVNFKPLSSTEMAQVITSMGYPLDESVLAIASGSPGTYLKIMESGGNLTILAVQKLLSHTNLNDLKIAIQELLKLGEDAFMGQLLHQFLYQQALKQPQIYAHPAQAVERFLRYTHNTHIDGAHRLQAAVLLAQNPEHERFVCG